MLEIMSLLTSNPTRQLYNLDRMLGDAKTNAANAECSSRLVYQRFDVFCKILCILSDLRKPDLLHTMQIGMLDHLQE
jgi:hypothetical protein